MQNIWFAFFSLMFFHVSSLADDGVSFSRTRLVLKEDEKVISFSIINNGGRAYLIQAGLSYVRHKASKVPFLVTPPLFRLNRNSENLIRIVNTASVTPNDRESIFYFYATAIPTMHKADRVKGEIVYFNNDMSELGFAVKTIMKLFYRPKGLSMPIEKAHGMLEFFQKDSKVIIKNPTPYYQTICFLSFDGVQHNAASNMPMIEPFSENEFFTGKKINSVTWSVMNDSGISSKKLTRAVAYN